MTALVALCCAALVAAVLCVCVTIYSLATRTLSATLAASQARDEDALRAEVAALSRRLAELEGKTSDLSVGLLGPRRTQPRS